MENREMSLCFPLFLGGTVDIYKFREYINENYNDNEFITIEDLLLIKVNIEKGKIFLDEDCIDFNLYYILNTSGIGIFIAEFSDVIEGALENTEEFLFENYRFQIGNKEKESSFYSFAINFFLHVFRLKNIREARSLYGLADIKEEVKTESGINFLLYGKGKIIPGFSGNFVLMFRKPEKMTEVINKFTLEGHEIYIESDDIIYFIDEGIEQKIILYLIIIAFYHRFLGLSTKYIEDFENDIRNLSEGKKMKETVGWEWERGELEQKRLNFLDFLSRYKQRESWFSTINMPHDIKRALTITNLSNNLSDNLKNLKFMINEISSLVGEKQTETFNFRTRRLEYLITILGGLGGVAAILAAILGGNISTNIRILAVLLIIMIPAGIAFFEYFIRKKIKMGSHRAYINARINDLTKEMNDFSRILKTLREEKEIKGSSKSEIIQLYENLIREKQNQIEELHKEIR